MPEREYLSLMGGEMWIERASPWIAVADRLPPNKTCVLTWGRHGYDIGSLSQSVTHWMPLPGPPTKETA